MSSWLQIKDSAGKDTILKRLNGPHDMPTEEGWRKVGYPASQWKLDASGRVIKKSRADLDADEAPKIAGRAEDRQRIGAKIDFVLTSLGAGDRVPLRKLLTRIVLKTRDIEDAL